MESNSIPTGSIVRMQGTPNILTSTIFRNQPALTIQLDSFSTATFTDASRRIFDPEEPGIATTISPAGSTLALTTADIAKTSFVQTRNMQATPNAGSALITITIWNTTGDFSKRWLSQSGFPTTSIVYKVGDLEPGKRYLVSKNNVALNSYIADGTGVINFTDSVTTGVTEYVVQFN
jgi:hypothetical protein